MNTTGEIVNAPLYEIILVGKKHKITRFPVFKSKVILGSSEVCDIVFPSKEISSIHACIEFRDNLFVLYDMDSIHGTKVKGQKIVKAELHLNDSFFLGANELILKNYSHEDVPPPLLDGLAIPASLINKINEHKLPSAPDQKLFEEKSKDKEIKIIYPLSNDPKADKTEYIFEEEENIYPIFQYDFNKSSVEVIILFKNLVYSADYLPCKEGVYYIVGKQIQEENVELPILNKKDKLPLLEFKNGQVEIFPLPSLNVQIFSEKSTSDHALKVDLPVHLSSGDIIRFFKKDLQIFIRNCDSPPKVLPAPILRRDDEFKKYLLLMLLFALFITISFHLFKIDRPIEKDVLPERIASILVKRKVINKTELQKDIQKRENVQFSPKNVEEEALKGASNPVKEDKLNEVLKASPNKGPTDNLSNNRVEKTDSQRDQHSPAKKMMGQASPLKGRGPVDAYRFDGLPSNINSILSKSGGMKNINSSPKVGGGSGSDVDGSSIKGADNAATLKSATVTDNIGSLAGSADGSLETLKGANGLSDKKGIYTAGLPYKTVILGGMDPELIKKILIDNIPQFRLCYQRVLDKNDMAYSGVVRLNFIIGPSGHVTKTGVDMSDDKIPVEVRNCVSNVLKGIKFPPVTGGGVIEVQQPFNFYPKMK